ncbi:MAG: glycosyltransferase [Armatimonadetes bacterium]|nr:glycosyltransferase [Armatimonadota bacterium]NIM23218.1 glycosyltransferase [Armatimonadota bacterium]NIM67086.1 glycosyltransferase [Armatimonadota bacterium]NIM75613.1 glycosyltransferase [Armatimonadota bacterium]NIN05275.1 glycosyltransferase [Armatimonadota bacterium]
MKTDRGKRAPKSLKVLMLAWEYPPRIVGGLARHVSELSLALAKAGVAVEVVTAHTPGTPAAEKLWPRRSGKPGKLMVRRAPPEPIHPLDFMTSIHQLNFGLLQQALSSGLRFHIIHAHDWLTAQAAWTLKQGLGIPLVCTIHATEYGRQEGIHNPLQSYINASEWLLTYESWRVICCSEFMGEEVKRVLSVPAEKVRVIPNGVELSRLRIPPREKKNLKEFRLRWAAPEEKIVFFAGRMVREKGAHILVDAVPRVLSAWPKVKFVIVGGGWTGHLAAQASALGVGNRVIFTGFISEEDLRRLYAVADVAVFPSLYEPFGIVALEAMAAGVPVVTSDIGGFREVVRHRETGIHTWANNADSLAWGIVEVLRKPEEAAVRALRAAKEVKTHYTWKKVAQRTLAVYNEIVSEAKHK